MSRLQEADWVAMRQEWENDPMLSMNQAALKYGVDRASVGRKAKKEDWQKRQKLSQINESAQRKADARVDSDGNQATSETQHARNSVAFSSPQESEDLRAEVLTRHRREWCELEGFRKSALVAMEKARAAGELDEWKVAKIAVDTAHANLRALTVKQSGEIRAWGLDYVMDFSKLSDHQLESMVKGER
jgi:hypothetical protein